MQFLGATWPCFCKHEKRDFGRALAFLRFRHILLNLWMIEGKFYADFTFKKTSDLSIANLF